MIDNKLVEVLQSSNIEETTANTLKEKFIPLFNKVEQWKIKAESIRVTDITQKREMQEARAIRLALKEIRVEADKKRKLLKEDSLRYAKAVQSLYNLIECLIVPIEKYCEEQEKFEEVLNAKIKEELRIQREFELSDYKEFIPLENINYGNMTEEDYLKILSIVKQKKQDKEKEEIERVEKEKKEAAEREKIRIENEKLKAEAKEKELLLEKEREKARKEKEALDKKLKAEAKEKELLLEKLKKKQEIEKIEKERLQNELRVKKAEEKKLALRPDKEKLIKLSNDIVNIDFPILNTKEGNEILNEVKILLEKIRKHINNKILNL